MFKLLFLIILIIGSFTECGKADPPRPAPPPAQQAEVKTKPQLPAERVCLQAGLGDTLETWVACYGKPHRDNGMMKSFRGDDIIVVFADNRAVNITFQQLQLGTVPPYAADMYPQDAKYLSTDEADDGTIRKVTKTGQSNLLKKHLPESEGKFMVITQYDAKSGKYLGTVAGLSHKK